MTFRELINKCSYKCVFNIIHKHHYKKESHEKTMAADISFLSAWNILSDLESNETNKWEIHFIDRGEDDVIIDVCIYSVEEDELYALDFVPWKDFIDAKVVSSSSFSKEETVAHILWEITFWGFSPQVIERNSQSLKKDAQE